MRKEPDKYKEPKKTLLQDWFDPNNIEHLKAYKQWKETGGWPEKFIPLSITRGFAEVNFVNSKIAEHWLKYKLVEQ